MVNYKILWMLFRHKNVHAYSALPHTNDLLDQILQQRTLF